MRRFILAAALAVCAISIADLSAQHTATAPRALTAADYARAERFMGYNTTPLVLQSGVTPTWLDGDRFWYRIITENGSEAFLIDPAKGTREAYTPPAQPGTGRGGQAGAAPAGQGARPEVLSPDGTRAVFTRDFNLWMRDVKSGVEQALTTDGVKDFGYATNNAGWTKSERPVVVWSPDSRRIATFQHDGRKVGDMYLVSTDVGHPRLEAWKYPLPGDEHIFTIHRVVIDTETGKMTRLQMPADPHRSTLCDHVVCGGEWADVQWEPSTTPGGGRAGQGLPSEALAKAGGDMLAFVSTSRDHKHETLRVAQVATGEVRTVLEETVATFFESGNGRVNWRFLPGSNEVIWFSQRENWGHLYLYDLTSGTLKNAITTGEGNVTQLLRVDEQARQLYFLGVGREKGRDPYFIHFYRVGFDGKGLQLLTPEDANHTISLAPSGRYFVDTYSKPDVPPVSVLRDMSGKVVMPLEKADITKLQAAGWQPPQPFTVKARDGVTDLYGLMYRPTNFDASKKYPIINNIYPGPQTGSVGSRSFSPARGDTQALAELGFIVVQIDGMGTPWRSKTFHEAYYGNMGDNTLPDQIAAMRELAGRHPWIDIERAGIYGHSGGGYATASALFRHPDFFKVGVSQAGNHDNRNYEDDWAEKWQGLLVKNPDGTTNYDNQANQLAAMNLKGKLLLAHGTMDANVPPNNTLVVVDALIRANKDFDLIMFPNRGHGFGSEPYMVRRRWDYFVKHLMGAEPPREYEFRPAR